MRKFLKIVLLIMSIILLSMQNVVYAKYVFSYEDTSIQMEIDKKAPIIEGVEENGKYNHDVQIYYYDTTGIKQAIYYYNSEEAKFDNTAIHFESGSKFSKEGYYKIIVIDNYHNIAKIEQFLIDKTKPEIVGIEEGIIYDLPPNVEYYDQYGIEKIEIKLPEELDLTYDMRVSNRNNLSDRTESTITVKISCTPQKVSEYKWYIKSETEKEFVMMKSNLEECYTFENLNSNTTYNIYCMAITEDNKAYMSNLITAGTLAVEKIKITEITDKGYTIKVSGIPEKYSSIYFPTWTNQNEQDDIIWYEEKVENGECIFNLNYDNHNKKTGIYRTHIYANENGNKVFLQSAKIWIQEEEPEPEKITTAGKTEIIVTDKASNVNKKEYYTDKVVTINYSTTKRKI